MNNVTIIGQLINTPEVKQISDKFKVAELLVSVKRPTSKYAKQGAQTEDTIQISVTGEKAELVASTLSPGINVVIIGEISSREYNGKYYMNVYARTVYAISQLEYSEQAPIPPSEATRYQQQPQQPFQVSDRDIPF